MKDSRIASTVQMHSPPCPVAEGVKGESSLMLRILVGRPKGKGLQEGACRTKPSNGSVVAALAERSGFSS